MGEFIRKGGSLTKYMVYWNAIKEFLNLMTHFYKVMPAVNHSLETEAFKIRHKVYCSELQYEAQNADSMEKDEFDHHSTQMVVYSKADKSYIGCVRMVHGRHNGITHSLPFEHHCAEKLNKRIIDMVKQSGHKYAEVSRLAIDREFRHIGRKNVAKSLGGQQKSSFVLLSLYLGLQAMARQQNVRYLFAIVEPRLLKNLHRHSVPAIQIGEGVDHRGLRVPILIDVEDIEKIIPSIMRPLYNVIHKDVSSLMAPLNEQAPEIAPLYLHDYIEQQMPSYYSTQSRVR